jgi:hypothetical protein
MFWRGLPVLAGVLAASPLPAYAADSFCVTCSAPQASYVCEVTLPVGVVPSQSPQLYCAYRLASEGGHASCSSRRAGETPCAGDYRQLAYQGPSLVGPSPDAQVPEAATDPATTNEGAADPAAGEEESAEPKTVVELTEQIVEQAGNGLEAAGRTTKDMARVTDEAVEEAGATVAQTTRSTGSKISSAAKTALNCLASWFKECE